MISISMNNQVTGSLTVQATERHADRLTWLVITIVSIIAVIMIAKQLKAIQ